MHTKRVLAFSLIAFSLLFLVGCKKAPTTPTVTTDQSVVNNGTVTPQTGTTSASDATKDQCIELMAYAFKVAQLQASWDTAAMSVWAQKANDLEIKYRGEGREYEKACNKFLADTTSFYNDVQKRVKELQ